MPSPCCLPDLAGKEEAGAGIEGEAGCSGIAADVRDNHMVIIDELLSTLDYKASVKDIRQGSFQTAVLTRGCGLASTPHDPGPHHNRTPVAEAGLLVEKEVEALARMANSESPSEAAIGMATINSLIEVDERRYTELNAGDLLATKGEGKRVAIVGHFPFVPRLRSVAKELWVVEREPQQGDFSEAESDKLIPQADVVGITGTAFINHSIGGLLRLCNPGAYVVILGGTAPLSPVLFDYGVSAISGTKVVEPETVLRYVSQGATFRQIRGIRLLTMEK
ncbi:Rossmann-like domain-containing protein [Chloroflexota bacterium]